MKIPSNLYCRVEEPYCNLASEHELSDWSNDQREEWNQTHRQIEKYNFYIKAFDFLTSNNIQGDYFEFGIHRARTFRMALTEARRHNQKEMWFHAFDSFQGLPPPESDNLHNMGNTWAPGHLATSEIQFREIIRKHGIYVKHVLTYPGFYSDKLFSYFKTLEQLKATKTSFVCVDCDFYESAVPVFNFIEDYLQEGTVIYIDDWWAGYKGNPTKGVSRAFRDFVNQSKYFYEEYLDVGAFGKSFITYK